MKKSLFLSLACVLGYASATLAAVLPENLRSPHFRTMNKHLDLGGVLYGYVDIDGDIGKLVDLGQGFFNVARKSNPREFPMEIDFNRILKATGLDGIKGIGMSSYKDGSRFRNKVFILAPGERRGLLKIGGGQPHAFKTWRLAPAGSDIVIEQDLNAKAVYDMVLEVADIVMGDEGRGMIQGQMKQPVPGMGFTLEKVINDLDLTLSVVIDMQENIALRIPDSPGDGVKIPLTDAVVTIDKLGWLIDHLALLAKEESEFRVFRGLQWEGIELVDEAPGDFKIYKPALMKHLRTGNLVFTTRREFAELCFSEKQSLAEDPKFQAAMEGLPRKGNGFAYLSTTLHETIENVFKQIPEEEMNGMEVPIIMSMVSFLIPGEDGPEASVTVNLPEGFFTVGNSGSSLKSGFATGALAGPMLVSYAGLVPWFLMSSGAEQQFLDEIPVDIEAVDIEAVDGVIEFGPDNELLPPPRLIPRDEIRQERLRGEAKEIDRIRRQLEQQERKVPRTVPKGD